jgi:hypothetical protein
MSYICYLFSNTGFNDTNIPDKPSLLGEGVKVSALDIMQDRNLTEIKVKARWDDVKDVDYISLTNSDGNTWYYYTSGAQMVATDVAVFPVVQDYILSIGGVDNLTIIDGITERVHVGDDTYGAYTEADPLTMPTKTMQILSKWIGGYSGGEYTNFNTYIESVVNLPLQEWGAVPQTYSDTTEAGDTVSTIVPRLAKETDFDEVNGAYPYSWADAETEYDIDGAPISGITAHSIVFRANYGIREALNTLRAMGVENAILNQVSIPNDYVTFSEQSYTIQAKFGDKSQRGLAWVQKLTGNKKEYNSEIPYIPKWGNNNQYISNNRVYYGEYEKFGLLSASGERCEYNAEDLAYEVSSVSSDDAPTVKVIADPRLTGKPYFRFKNVDNDETDTGFWKNCVGGMVWQNVPLIYTNPSGTSLNTLRYENSKRVEETAYGTRTAQRALSTVTGVAETALGIASAVATGGATAHLALSGLTNVANATASYVSDKANTNAQRRNELAELEIANSATVPEVLFPYNAEVIRDFYGNGALVYRYVYTWEDAHRIDTLLTAYGYRYTKQLELKDFKNRKLFNFVKCSSITIGGRQGISTAGGTVYRQYPKWVNKGIEEQLKNGVRIWHASPRFDSFGSIAYNKENEIVNA